MNSKIKWYCWSAIAGLATYVLVALEMNRELHCLAHQDFLTMFVFPICPAIFVSSLINLKWAKPWQRRYFWRFAAGMGAYVLGLAIANHVSAPPAPYQYLLILLPVLPLIYISYLFIRYVADQDEMKRKIYMEALAFSGAATGFTCFSYLFVRDWGAPEFHAEWAFYILMGYYLVGLFFSWRRYR